MIFSLGYYSLTVNNPPKQQHRALTSLSQPAADSPFSPGLTSCPQEQPQTLWSQGEGGLLAAGRCFVLRKSMFRTPSARPAAHEMHVVC